MFHMNLGGLEGQCDEGRFRPELILCTGYGVVFTFVIVFFCWEGGPWHKSRKHESWCMLLVLMLVPAASTLADWQVEVQCDNHSSIMEWVVIEMLSRQGLLIVLAFQMQAKFWPRMYQQFFELRPLCPKPAMESTKEVGSLALHISQTLQESIDESPVLLPNDWLPHVLFVACMVEDFIWFTASRRVVTVTSYGPLLIVGGVLVHLCVKMNQNEHKVQEIHASMKHVVKKGHKDTLQYLLAQISVASLIEVCGGDMIRLLTDIALEKGKLTLLSKAILVDALMMKGVRHSDVSHKAVVSILLSCKRTELTAMKNILDSSGTYNNLYKLVYEDLANNTNLQKVVKDHIWEQGMGLRTDRGAAVGVKVLSDVDDTLYSSGGVFPAGCDKRFPKHLVYPGCLPLFEILSRDIAGFEGEMRRATKLEGGFLSPLIFISARPHIYKDVAEGKSYRLFRSLVSEQRISSLPTLIPGTLRAGLKACVTSPFRNTSAWRRVGVNKHHAYLHFRHLYPEYNFVFCGDDGQGDLYAAQLMLARQKASSHHSESLERRHSHLDTRSLWQSSGDDLFEELVPETEGEDGAEELPSRSPALLRTQTPQLLRSKTPQLVAALIHNVLPHGMEALAREAPGERGPEWEERLRARGLIFHRTYVGAAVVLHEIRPALVTLEDLRQVTQAAVREFEVERRNHKGTHPQKWRDAESELKKDLEKANAALAAGGLPVVQPTATMQRHSTTDLSSEDEKTSNSSSDESNSTEDDRSPEIPGHSDDSHSSSSAEEEPKPNQTNRHGSKARVKFNPVVSTH